MKKILVAAAGMLASLPALAAVAPPPVELPEPGALGLLALGLAGIVASRLRRK